MPWTSSSEDFSSLFVADITLDEAFLSVSKDDPWTIVMLIGILIIFEPKIGQVQVQIEITVGQLQSQPLFKFSRSSTLNNFNELSVFVSDFSMDVTSLFGTVVGAKVVVTTVIDGNFVVAKGSELPGAFRVVPSSFEAGFVVKTTAVLSVVFGTWSVNSKIVLKR